MEALEKTTGSITTEKKSPSAFKTIGEVADQLELPPHVLRFWETKFNQIKPHKRRGGHRYYRPQDVDLLTEIKSLLHDRGFTIKGAQKHLSSKKKAPSPEQTSLFTAPENESPSMNSDKLRNILNELSDIKDLLNQYS